MGKKMPWMTGIPMKIGEKNLKSNKAKIQISSNKRRDLNKI